MPPSPSLRGSLRGDPLGDSHKRGRSLESGLSFKEKDDDLALFNELQSKERDHFLLESTDDFEDLLSSKMRSYSEFKLGINISARGESSDLLNEDVDKNDYEWLLTPPDTPLFPSLDDEPAPVDLVHNGRARSRPVSLSRSSTMERSNRSSRGSPSPQHLSPSPRSGNSTFHGRPSSAPLSNPAPSHSRSPSRRPSPPPVKPLTPPSRSLTPTSRRITAGSPGKRGASPVRTSRGNSASPKVRAWQSNIPGFSLEAPPNLRTSLTDRPASYIRGSSPASRTTRDSSTKFGRQSMSPTPRSISSSHSQERDRDRLSSHSKGSIASSGDDDLDSFQSFPVSVSERPMSRKGVSGYSSGRPLALSKKPAKSISSSSAPKRSFDSAMRQMDRMTPQNMFRPLLSSVPSSTFYSGKNSALISRNSYVTTSSNASSDPATNAAHDSESVLSHDDMASDCARATFSDNNDEVFIFDKMDSEPDDAGPEAHDALSEARLGEPSKGFVLASNPGDSEESGYRDHSIVAGNNLICSICGSHYRPDELAESEYNNICSECKRKELLRSSDLFNRLETPQSSSSPLTDNSEESRVTQPIEGPPEASHHDSHSSQSCPGNFLSLSMDVEIMDAISKQEVTREHKTLDDTSNTSNGSQDVAQGAGISVLLNRSSCAKGHIVHGRTINSSAISFEDLSYARDLTSSMRSSIGHGNFSASSSSIDLTSTRHGEMFVRRQWSGKLSDSSSKPQSVSSFSGTSGPLVSGAPLTEGNNYDMEDTSQASVGVGESHVLHEIDEDGENRRGHIQNVRETNITESSLTEEGMMSENSVGQVDVLEDLPQCSLSTMSEIEINDSHPSSPRSQIDVVVREDSEDSSTAMHRDKDVKDVSRESEDTDRIVEESTVTVEGRGGRRTRSLTLEEATDTILFCSSIIHDLAYKAANIAIEKEKENLEPLEALRPTVTIPDKSSSDRKDPSRFTTGMMPKTQKARKRRTAETEAKPPLTQNDDEPDKPVVRNVGLPNNSDNMKPPKLESKCNCTIM